ncbi:hypothetical protein HO173_004842 [Letharia columbiana]|uniref:Uncharacterized protein n=1 Tax=Letharia columbiana TaxID=112416 RepID=A0A8H6L652_9LECA|nr:uncharacterized protein HO173_004842 [Letharia columbiana]KAF6236963.1 hypothetical protein HO173_004842 [Letharia columbiana]
MVNKQDSDEPHDIIMPPKKAQWGLTSSTVKAEDINPQSCAGFRRKWTPTEFCNLPLSERTAILSRLLTSSDSLFIVEVDGGYNFATEYNPIHGAMPLLYDICTNKQIAREACEVFYQNNTFILSSRWLPHMVLDQTNTWIMRETIQPHLLFRSVHILLDHYEPQTPNKTPLELASLLSCTKLDRLDIEICTPEILANDPEGIKKRSVKEAMAVGVVIRQLMEKFGVALKVWIGGPGFATQEKEDITWMWDRPSGELARVVLNGRGTESQMIMHLMWTIWSKR